MRFTGLLQTPRVSLGIGQPPIAPRTSAGVS